MAHTLLIAIVVLGIVLMLLRPRGIAEVYWAGGGALLLVLFRLIPLRLAGKAIAQGSDVYLFLTGMMLLSELAREQGVFDWASAVAVGHARGSRVRLLTLIYGIGTLVTICMSNDATAVVLTPAVLASVRRAKIQPLPYLFACAMIANAASFVLPISNPANLVVFHQDMPPLGQWIASFLLPSVASIAVTYLVLRWYFRDDLHGSMEGEAEEVALSTNGRLVLAGLGLVVVTLLIASAMNWDLGLPTCLAATIITVLICWKSHASIWRLLREISWATLALVAALFILVNAVESVGALKLAQSALQWTQHLPRAAGSLLAAFVVGVGNNLVNNLPLGLIAGSTLSASHVDGLIAHAILIGVDLGPNLSVTGSLATILWLIALRKEGLDVSYGRFLKAGALAMPLALLASVATLIAVHTIVG